ncbi:MAG: class I adenylate-forming enzyme family protein [Steroidobacteraceae bacterium]
MPDPTDPALPPARPTPRRLLHEGLLCLGSDARLRSRTALLAEGRAYSFGQLLDASLRLARVLRCGGVERGDRVAIYLHNGWACAVSIYATLIAGAAIVLVNPQTKEEKLEFILRDSGARALVSDSHLSRVFMPVLPRLSPRPAVICSRGPIAEAGIESFETAIAAGQPLAQKPSVIPLDLAAIIYTSGSTGRPKGVMQTHQAMMFAAGSLIEYLRLTTEDRIICALPLSFDYGLYQLLMSIELGACLVLERSFTYPAQIYARLQDERVSVFPGVPTIFATLIGAHRHKPLSFTSVTRITNTAAALPDEFVADLREIFPNALIYKMYGLTECKRVSYLEPALIDAKPGSVGRAIPGTEVYLLSENGGSVAPGKVGILHTRGPHVMAGYWNQPDLTDQMLKPGKLPGERVLCTQDLFRMDEEGFLYFVGRTDDIIKTRGEKVSPVEVENALHRIPGVREAAVIGVPDPLLGEAVRAYVVVDPGAGLTEHALRVRSAAFLESHMAPTQIFLVESLPRSENGKVDRRVLLELKT